MLKNGFKIALILTFAILLHKTAFAAQVLELPPEELAQESVLPVFDRPVSVKSRNIITDKKFDVNLFYGFAMTEPIADVSKFGAALYYNWSEDHAIGALFAKNSSGLSTYANQLNSQYNLDFNRVPKPDMLMMADYNIKAFYGKMSLTKSAVLNTLLFGSASAGLVKYSHKSYPAIAVGLGQKFYFNKNWAARFDLRLYANQAPIPFKAGNALKPGNPTPDPGSFEERVTFTTNLDFGISYLF
jgi:outer membrane beta-barrel protein